MQEWRDHVRKELTGDSGQVIGWIPTVWVDGKWCGQSILPGCAALSRAPWSAFFFSSLFLSLFLLFLLLLFLHLFYIRTSACFDFILYRGKSTKRAPVELDGIDQTWSWLTSWCRQVSSISRSRQFLPPFCQEFPNFTCRVRTQRSSPSCQDCIPPLFPSLRLHSHTLLHVTFLFASSFLSDSQYPSTC